VYSRVVRERDTSFEVGGGVDDPINADKFSRVAFESRAMIP
jgi:hypothetical protein